ncbi:gliding motility-associated-like protein [Flavobacterium arsenatis]|uniref:Gliding motility-associated-like protein n=1 Tax=Flavobacterium arsenatis TaxID=1484332 RepID=A0ABU1TU67_9FLAO|nr:gliding motility-associated C-terminal domain-containing protein [Flavobacterium arsenatis]MDR6969424.1 gliding motility-associated-like protein [Flavobacterium arsenatis]
MKSKFTINPIVVLLFLVFFSCQKSFSQSPQCPQVESILVAACSPTTNTEGYNEMVRFRVGSNAINVSAINVTWATVANAWQGLIQNSTTQAKVATLNAAIDLAGGCGNLIEPTNGVLPANASVILVTSYLMNTTSNSFGALNENTYIIFQNNPDETDGHFGNYNATPALRTLIMSFGGGCNDTVTYQRASLSNAMGDTVLFTTAGVPTYVNYGCSAPTQPFSVDAGPATLAPCAGTTINLAGTAQGQQSVSWTAASGTFSNSTNLSSTYTVPANAAGQVITLTLTATNTCGATITDTITLTVGNSVTPTFNLPTTLCNGATAPALPPTSTNGITGTWSPTAISNTANGTYVFTPATGQCATAFTLSVIVGTTTTPTFNLPTAICSGTTAPALPTTSTNGITGTWSPAVINNTTNGSYTFTPTAGQCSVPFTLNVVISNSITPIFTIANTICSGSTAPSLPTTSNNGLTGTWSPAVISNTANGAYVFTPTAGQCGVPFTLNVTVTTTVAPTFAISNNFCNGSVVPVLPTTSNNGITGTWSPTAINNTTNGNYIFTPTTGQCASTFTLNVTVSPIATPTFNISNTLCSGTTAPLLPATSANGITGTWSPAIISNTTDGSYVFTPNAGQCSSSFTLNVTVTNSISPTFTITDTFCNGTTAPVLPATSNNGIIGTWSPSVISNTTSGAYLFTPNAGQCGENFTLNVTVTPTETPDFATTLTICNGQTVPALATTSPNGITGSWSPSSIDNTANGTYVFTPNAGQCAISLTLQVMLSTFEIDFDQKCVEGEFIVTALPLNDSFDPNTANYLWKNSQGITVGTNEETLNITDLMNVTTITFPATYTVTVSNTAGCSTTENVIIYGAFCTIPKGISPNNDNSNDSFDLTGLGVDDIKIYNRYGTEVFHQRNYTNQWKGQTDKGDELPTATYFYVIKKNTGESVTGWVYINR